MNLEQATKDVLTEAKKATVEGVEALHVVIASLVKEDAQLLSEARAFFDKVTAHLHAKLDKIPKPDESSGA